jgi:hypothetical protein
MLRAQKHAQQRHAFVAVLQPTAELEAAKTSTWVATGWGSTSNGAGKCEERGAAFTANFSVPPPRTTASPRSLTHIHTRCCARSCSRSRPPLWIEFTNPSPLFYPTDPDGYDGAGPDQGKLQVAQLKYVPDANCSLMAGDAPGSMLWWVGFGPRFGFWRGLRQI